VSNKRLCVEAGQFFFTDRERNDRNVFCRNLLVTKLLVERNVGVTVDGRNNSCLLACGTELLDRGNPGLPVGETERRVVDRDIFLSYTL